MTDPNVSFKSWLKRAGWGVLPRSHSSSVENLKETCRIMADFFLEGGLLISQALRLAMLLFSELLGLLWTMLMMEKKSCFSLFSCFTSFTWSFPWFSSSLGERRLVKAAGEPTSSPSSTYTKILRKIHFYREKKANPLPCQNRPSKIAAIEHNN